MKHSVSLFLLSAAFLAFASCGSDEPVVSGGNSSGGSQGGDTPQNPVSTNYAELYRPQVHFTPARNWMNDPNGMVYLDGTWHLFYQYNPFGNGWGHMSWGHATSTDLLHWRELPVALSEDDLGAIFSGSCVVDKDNTAGFGAGAIIAFYTSAKDHQQQSMAYSVDGGMTFKKYADNPVIGNSDKADFRDPKVFWDADHDQWVMSLARGWQYAIDFYTSKNLRQWTLSGSFSVGVESCRRGQWECPDLITLTTPDGQKKQVLIVSVNPGGPNGGSGTFYFTGSWDGKTFTADADCLAASPLWLDQGCDNYAGVTWSNAPEGRSVFLGWMNNWSYAGDVPCSPWRSAMTLPHELSLVSTSAGLRLSQAVVGELDGIASPWTEVAAGETFPESDAYQLQIEIDASKNCTLTLGNGSQAVDIDFVASARSMSIARQRSTGVVDFASFNMPNIRAKYSPDMTGTTLLDIVIDRSSVEILAAGGTFASTNLFFPSSIYNTFSLKGQTTKARVRGLKNVWR